MESDKQKQKFPPPPDYFKDFTTPDKYSPPKLSVLNKMEKLIIFGSESKTDKINISYNPVNVDDVGKKLLEQAKPPNIEKFKNLKIDGDTEINSDQLNLNIVDEIENEILFLRKRYERILEDIIKNVGKAGNRNKIALIGLTFQKINFYLIALRRKAILKKTIDFYKKEIEDCKKTSENVDNNLKNFRKYLDEDIKNYPNH